MSLRSLVVAAALLASCTPCLCPASSITLALAVDTADGGVANVAAKLDGVNMDCSLAASCRPTAPLGPGTYPLEVSAPGFRTITRDFVISDPSVDSSSACQCHVFTFEPRTVTLEPL